MNYSTAKWLIGILSVIGFVTITFDLNRDIPPSLIFLVRPIVFVTLFPVLLLIIGLLIARGKKEEKISTKSLRRSAVIIAALFVYRLMTGYFD
jgi:heme A synthase